MLLVGVALLVGPAAASGARDTASGELSNRVHSQTLLWSALNGKVQCGLVNTDIPGPERILCFARWIPAPRDGSSEGDPGFVYLKPHGGPDRTRISQYTWEEGKRLGNGTTTPLRPGTTWTRLGLGVKCVVRARSVRCTNSDGRGFVLHRDSYRVFGSRRAL